MKNKLYLVALFFCTVQILSCKKDQQKPQQQTLQQSPLNNGVLSFSVNGELVTSDIDTTKDIITVTVNRAADMHALTASFTLANHVNASINNKAVNSGSVIDLSQPVVFKIVSADNKRSTSFHLVAQTDLGYFGLTGNIIAEKGLNKSYDYYFDQFDGSTFESINCGPTVTTMAIKWADSTFTKKPVNARNLIRSSGGWWTTDDVQTYLSDDELITKVDTLSDIESQVKKSIDNNNLIILCLDMFPVPLNQVSYQHTHKFYTTAAAGWGHFLLVKGYIEMDSGFYLEIYDPYSGGEVYNTVATGQYKGKDRYYSSSDLQTAISSWWPYAIIVAPKGQQVTASSRLKINSIKNIPQASGR